MASFFRKLGASVAPAFRKLPSDIGKFGRKLSSGASLVEKNLDKASDFLGKIDRAVPNPITKTIRGAINGVADVSGGFSRGGQALDALSRGDYKSAYSLGKSGLNQARSGVTSGASSVAPFLML